VSGWTQGEDEWVRIVDGAVLSVVEVPDRDNAEGIAEPGGWRFADDGFDPPIPYYGSHDAREQLHDSAEEAMRAADAWLKAVRP